MGNTKCIEKSARLSCSILGEKTMEFIEISILNFGIIAIFTLMFTNGLLSAPPSEFTLAVAGFWASTNNVAFSNIVFWGVLGNLFGTMVLYFIGYYYGHNWLFNFKEKYQDSNIFFLKKTSNVIPSRAFFDFLILRFNDRGLHWLGILRCFPTIRSIVSLPAGMAKVNLLKFLAFSTAGILIWNVAWVSIGFIVKNSWQNYHWPIAIPLFISLIIIVFIFKKRLSKLLLEFENRLIG